MPTLYFGGSFNPIHHGHLAASRFVAEALGLNRIILVPNSTPPHKANAANLAEAADRFAMCQLAVCGDPLFSVDGVESNRSGPSYTIDTIAALESRGERDIHWLIGADMLMYLPYWHRPQELLAKVNFIVMARPGWTLDWQSLPAEFRKLKEDVVEAPLIQISSTEIRDRVSKGLPIDYLTPPAVCRYIRNRGLYLKQGV